MSYVKQNFQDGDTLYADQLNDMDDIISEVAPVTDEAEFPVTPSQFVENSLYNVATNGTYGNNGAYKHAFFNVTPGETYYVTGSCATSNRTYPLGAFYGPYSDYRMSIFGDEANTQYSDYEIVAPENANRMVVNSCNLGEEIKVFTKRRIIDALKDFPEVTQTLAQVVDNETKLAVRVGRNFAPRTVDAVIREAKRNPFEWKSYDKGYVSFVFDDLRDSIDHFAAVFEEYGIPICIAAIPARRYFQASGLTEPKGSYTVGMDMRQVMQTAQGLGGEIMTHNSIVINSRNQYDYSTMYEYFVNSKDTLEELNLTVRGIIRAGGPDQISRSPEIERWLVAEYDYSNMGYTLNHTLERESINQPVADIKALIHNAATNHDWVRFMLHDYDYGDYFTDETVLREILDYCVSEGVAVVTYAHMFDTFGTSKIEKMIAGGTA